MRLWRESSGLTRAEGGGRTARARARVILSRFESGATRTLVRSCSSGVSTSSVGSCQRARVVGGWPTKRGLPPGLLVAIQKRSTSNDATPPSMSAATLVADGCVSVSESKPRCEISLGGCREHLERDRPIVFGKNT